MNFADGVAKLPWSHNLVLLEKLKDMDSRWWYGCMAIENGWSVDIMEMQISTNLMERQNSLTKIQNFENSLPKVKSELAIQTMKDPSERFCEN